MCISASKLTRLEIHLFYEFFGGTGSQFSDRESHFISRLEHNSHQSLLDGEFLICVCIDTGTVGFGNASGSRCSHSKFLWGIQFFTAEESSHDLGDTGRVLSLVRVFGVEDCSGKHIYQNCRFTFNLWPFDPVLDGVGVCRLFIIWSVRIWCRSCRHQRSTVFVCGEDRDCLCDDNRRAENTGQYPPEKLFLFYIHVITFLHILSYSISFFTIIL